jgi:hypothetical protein
MYDTPNVVFCFMKYLPEDGWKRLTHVGGLPYDCILLYLIFVQVLELTLWNYLTAWDMGNTEVDRDFST